MLTLPTPNEYAELTQLRDQTWLALTRFVLDPDDNKNVIRYEKLTKLYLTVCKSLAKLEGSKPKTTKNTLESFLFGTNEPAIAPNQNQV